MKKILFTITLLFSLLTISNVYANDISVSIDNKTVNFTDVKPQIINGRTMVPVRDIYNALGANVDWNKNTKQITSKLNNITTIMQINNSILNINGYYRAMDCTPVIINNKTLIPARYIAESFGYKVDWDNKSQRVNIIKTDFVKIHFVDVGQGDCMVITSSNNCMVIDAGEEGNESIVVNYIKSLGISKIDYVVATHPHSDHIGSLDGVINSFAISNVIMPDIAHTTKAFENLLTSIENSNANVIKATPNTSYTLGNATFTILAPSSIDNKEMNNNSVVIKLSYGNNSSLLVGDAEKESEYNMISAGYNLSADLLKVGHHGSSSSTTTEFLSKVNPSIAVICVGAGNTYGHPTSQTLNRLQGKTVYRTDLNGNIIANMTGNNIYVVSSKIANTYNNASKTTANNTTATNTKSSTTKSKPTNTTTTATTNTSITGTYILNTNTKKVHYANCKSVAKISAKNKQSFTGNPISLKSKGYTACQNCKPF